MSHREERHVNDLARGLLMSSATTHGQAKMRPEAQQDVTHPLPRAGSRLPPIEWLNGPRPPNEFHHPCGPAVMGLMTQGSQQDGPRSALPTAGWDPLGTSQLNAPCLHNSFADSHR